MLERELGFGTDSQNDTADLLAFSDPDSISISVENSDNVLSDEGWMHIMQDHDADNFVSGITLSDIACCSLGRVTVGT